MSRKPAHVLAASKKPVGRAGIWAAIRKSGETFSQADIRRATDINKRTIKGYLDCLVAGGYIERINQRTPPVWRLIKDTGAEAPRIRIDGTSVTQGLATEAMWRTLRIGGQYSAAELALTASTEKAPVAVATAKAYLKYMRHAGYLRLVHQSGKGPRSARLTFIRANDPGPLPPQIQRIKQVFDPNSNKVVWPLENGDKDA